jgi:hypothetical protein
MILKLLQNVSFEALATNVYADLMATVSDTDFLGLLEVPVEQFFNTHKAPAGQRYLSFLVNASSRGDISWRVLLYALKCVPKRFFG